VINRKRLIVTDFLSTIPYYIHLDSLEVSSLIRDLCFLSGYKYTIDELFFSSVCKWGYRPADNTFFNEIKKIPANSCWIIDRSTNKIDKDPDYFPYVPRSIIRIRREIEESVEKNIPEGIFGLLCSGGLDSSIIYKLVERITHNFILFHINNDEENFLRLLEIPSDIEVIKLRLEEQDIREVLYYNESPVDLGSVLPQYALACAMEGYGIRVVLSGDGADELFGGYKRIANYDSQYSDVFDELVYYHLPRLYKQMGSKGIKLRCPYLSKSVIECALGLPYRERIFKRHLKKVFSDLIPVEIIQREKLPLKSKQVLEGGLERRYELCKIFREEVIDEYRRCGRDRN